MSARAGEGGTMKQNANKKPEAAPDVPDRIPEAAKEEKIAFDIRPGTKTSVVSGNEVLYFGDEAIRIEMTVAGKGEKE